MSSIPSQATLSTDILIYSKVDFRSQLQLLFFIFHVTET